MCMHVYGTRGVLAIAWSLADPELLLSCGKDNRILCWNPNTAEVSDSQDILTPIYPTSKLILVVSFLFGFVFRLHCT